MDGDEGIVYEYRTLSVGCLVKNKLAPHVPWQNKLEDKLNKFGAAGWRAMHMTDDGSTITVVMERRMWQKKTA